MFKDKDKNLNAMLTASQDIAPVLIVYISDSPTPLYIKWQTPNVPEAFVNFTDIVLVHHFGQQDTARYHTIEYFISEGHSNMASIKKHVWKGLFSNNTVLVVS